MLTRLCFGLERDNVKPITSPVPPEPAATLDGFYIMAGNDTLEAIGVPVSSAATTSGSGSNHRPLSVLQQWIAAAAQMYPTPSGNHQPPLLSGKHPRR